jgi:hypothetical protein
VNFCNIEFHENPAQRLSSLCGQTDGHDDPDSHIFTAFRCERVNTPPRRDSPYLYPRHRPSWFSEILTEEIRNSTSFWDLMPYGQVEVYRRFGRMYCCYSAWFFAGCFYSSILKMEAVRSSDTPVNLYHSIRRHMSDDSALNSELFHTDWAVRVRTLLLLLLTTTTNNNNNNNNNNSL